jgi:hypothetical protein
VLAHRRLENQEEDNFPEQPDCSPIHSVNLVRGHGSDTWMADLVSDVPAS